MLSGRPAVGGRGAATLAVDRLPGGDLVAHPAIFPPGSDPFLELATGIIIAALLRTLLG